MEEEVQRILAEIIKRDGLAGLLRHVEHACDLYAQHAENQKTWQQFNSTAYALSLTRQRLLP